jgi:protein-S-isoprenylcysteine O-methyltransferase Ste14
MQDAGRQIVRFLARTPVQSFILCPLAVTAFEFAWRGGRPQLVWWGLPLMLWGFLQYKLVGRWRGPRAGGGPGMDTMPERILDQGPYRYTRNPMYLGHLIFLTGLAITFWSWFAVVVLAARAVWFHRRVLADEARLQEEFGAGYDAYRARVKRWIPGVLAMLLAATVGPHAAEAQPAPPSRPARPSRCMSAPPPAAATTRSCGWSPATSASICRAIPASCRATRPAPAADGSPASCSTPRRATAPNSGSCIAGSPPSRSWSIPRCRSRSRT